ncbi:MAG: hypothetical protein NTU47_14065 [Ignavibacteriales bacterium]|nr:hypothetical protein [Ignavibacteriales bacterium]
MVRTFFSTRNPFIPAADDNGIVCPNHHVETDRSNSAKPGKDTVGYAGFLKDKQLRKYSRAEYP